MKKALQILAVSCLVLVLLACGKPEIKERQIAEWQTAMEALAEEKEALDQKREELEKMHANIRDSSTKEEDDSALDVDDLMAKAKTLGKEIEVMAGNFREKAADDLYKIDVAVAKIRKKNAAVSLPEQHLAITRMMSDEDIRVAQEFIQKHGDYWQAIRIFKEALELDPDNQVLKDALAKAEVDQFMTEERFALVENGMSEDQVTELLGKVYHQYVQKFAEKGVLAWFYRREDGGTAAVYFREKNDDNQVYETDFNAKEAASAEETGEE